MTNHVSVDQPVLAYLGPGGTLTEQALHSQTDLLDYTLTPTTSIPEVLRMVGDGRADFGFVAIENSIEGSVNITQDTLTFDTDLLIQREVVSKIELNLLAPAGVGLGDVEMVLSFPHAIAQCRTWLAENLPEAATGAANSTADAARQVAEDRPPATAAIATSRAAQAYGLEILVPNIEDHPENETRFVLVAAEGVPGPSGHDKTSLVVFQDADRPGSLLGILQEFAARSINLTRLESRPTKQGLGDYCFLIDLEGHVADEVVADCLRNLHMKNGRVKFLGSYPAASDDGGTRDQASEASRDADQWLDSLRGRIGR
ncbi:MAG: prephenate dehydratase [Acidimicrobiales bacterium]|nr:prephenate dehydratase [Acidimicrobiales bacterium]